MRFTQEHIRTTFRDSRLVEPTIDEIEARPGRGDYDVILHAPFPHIEIIRWRPPSYTVGADVSEGGEETPDGQHWFTLDNRRLYCLQKAAVALLPKRVAVVVEILYADDGHVWRKYDTETLGLSVSISHSTRLSPIARWAWRDELLRRESVAPEQQMQSRVISNMQRDDRRVTVDALQDTLGTSESAVDRLSDAIRRFEEHEALCASQTEQQRSWSTASTAASTIDDSAEEEVSDASSSPMGRKQNQASVQFKPKATSQDVSLSKLRSCLEGVQWRGQGSDAYELFVEGTYWTCLWHCTHGPKKLTLFFDVEYCAVYWDVNQAYYFDASEINLGTNQIKWYAFGDWNKTGPCFTWRLLSPPKPGAGSAAMLSGFDALTALAVKEISTLLAHPAHDGYVRLPHWNVHYANQLGPLRAFLESRPELFVVTPGRGHRFTVTAAPEAASETAKGMVRVARGTAVSSRRFFSDAHAY